MLSSQGIVVNVQPPYFSVRTLEYEYSETPLYRHPLNTDTRYYGLYSQTRYYGHRWDHKKCPYYRMSLFIKRETGGGGGGYDAGPRKLSVIIIYIIIISLLYRILSSPIFYFSNVYEQITMR